MLDVAIQVFCENENRPISFQGKWEWKMSGNAGYPLLRGPEKYSVLAPLLRNIHKKMCTRLSGKTYKYQVHFLN